MSIFVLGPARGPSPTTTAQAADRRDVNASELPHGAHWLHYTAALMSPGRELARRVELARRQSRRLLGRRGTA